MMPCRLPIGFHLVLLIIESPKMAYRQHNDMKSTRAGLTENTPESTYLLEMIESKYLQLPR